MKTLNIKAIVGKFLMRHHLKSMRNALGVRNQVYRDQVNITYDEIRKGNKNNILYLHGFSDKKESFYYSAKFLSSKNYPFQ